MFEDWGFWVWLGVERDCGGGWEGKGRGGEVRWMGWMRAGRVGWKF